MNTVVKMKVAGKPIERILKNNTLVSVDSSAQMAAIHRLHSLRETYMMAPVNYCCAFKLPTLKK